MRRVRSALAAPALAFLAGCIRHEVEVKPIKIEDIHITVDVNVHVQKELEGLFAFEEKGAAGAQSRPAPRKPQ